MHSGYENYNNHKPNKFNRIFDSSKNNNYEILPRETYKNQVPFLSTQNHRRTPRRLGNSDRSSFKSSDSSMRKRSYTPVKQFYNFSNIAKTSERKVENLGGSWSSKNNELYGNLKGMVMFGQKREAKYSKVSHSNLRKK